MLSINFGQANIFITGSYPSFTLNPQVSDIGCYDVSVKVTDNKIKPLTATYTFKINVKSSESKTENDNSD